MNRISPAVAGLLIVNLLLFGAGVVVPAWLDRIVAAGALWYPGHGNFRGWQAVSHLFLHAGFLHIFFNMFALVSFGPVLERGWGAGRFLIFYLLCGVGAGLIQTGVNWYEFGVLHERLFTAGITPSDLNAMLTTGRELVPTDPAIRAALYDLYRISAAPMLGASGAIYGLLVAFGLTYPDAKLALIFFPVPITAKVFIPILLTLDLLSGVTGFSLLGAGIAHFAHLGGAMVGFLLMLFWRQRRRSAERGTGIGSTDFPVRQMTFRPRPF